MSTDYQIGQITQLSETQIKDGVFGMDFAKGSDFDPIRLRELLESSRGQCARLIEENKRLRELAALMQQRALEGYRAWDAGNNLRAWRTLKALAGLSRGYWPDLDALREPQ